MTASNTPIALAKPRERRAPQWRRWATSYLMLAPFLILFVGFTLLPIAQSLYLSMTDYNGIRDPNFVGLENFRDLLGDKRFLKSMSNIFIYVVAVVALNAMLGLLLAVVFRKQGRFNQVMRTLMLLPAVTSSIASLTVWGWILTGEEYGLANTILGVVGVEPVRWLSTPWMAVPIMVVLALWGGLGMTMLFFLAGLQNISPEYLEAAAIDGANPVQRFWNITVPLLRPTFVYITITSTISAFQVFEVGYVLWSAVSNVGGPLDAALTPVLYLYFMGFSRFRLGYASAIAWVMFLIIIVLTVINLRLTRADEAD